MLMKISYIASVAAVSNGSEKVTHAMISDI